MSRSSKKGPYVEPKLLEKIAKLSAHGGSASGGKPGAKDAIKTWARNSEISPEMIGFAFDVHNGKSFITVRVTDEMVGHKLGEFSPTKKFLRHGGKMQKEIEKKA